MKQALIGLVAIAVFVISTFVTPSLSLATNGGTSSGYQQEAREDDYHYGGCYNNPCAGRCGPGCSTYFGTNTTYACQQHDNCIRDHKCAGYSGASTHYRCLTGSRGLGKAAQSLVKYHWNNAKTWVKDTWQSTWARVGS